MRKLQTMGLVSAVTATLLLGACGSPTDSGPTLNSQSAAAVGGALAAEMGGVATSFTATGMSSGGVGGGFFLTRAQAIARWAVPGMRPNLLSRACNPTLDNATDSDQDGVPDNATWTFTQANCTTSNFFITGLIHVVDPSTTAVGFTGSFTDFYAHVAGQAGDFFSVKLNGSHGVLGTSATGTLTEDLVTDVNGKSGSATLHGTLAHLWNIQFDAAQGQSIVMNGALPDGSFGITGSYVYDINGNRFSFSVNTQTALAFDSSCALANPFSTGVLRAHLGGPNATVYVQVTYNGCGVNPTVVLVGR